MGMDQPLGAHGVEIADPDPGESINDAKCALQGRNIGAACIPGFAYVGVG